MIYLIFKSYLTTLLSVGAFSLLLLVSGLYLILKKPTKLKAPANSNQDMRSFPKKSAMNLKDISAIAGDDVTATKLDLARAYIETGNSLQAKKMLSAVIKQGTVGQKKDAQLLLDKI